MRTSSVERKLTRTLSSPSQNTVKYTQLGCTLITTLLASPDGVRYLAEDKLLRQIADSLVQLDPVRCDHRPSIYSAVH